MGEVVGSVDNKKGMCLSLNEVSISLALCVVTTKIFSKMFLFGKIVLSRNFTPKDVEQTCSNLWKTRTRVEPTNNALAGPNTFQFFFESGVDSKRVLDHGPRCINGHMLVLLSWSSGFGAKELSFNSIWFWVQIHFLPNDYYSKVNANVLGALAGTVVNIELDELKPVTWKKWIRVQVDVYVNRPLCSGCFFKVANGKNKWIQLKYEKLGTFCYLCGMLGHQRRDCSLSSLVTVLNDQGILFPLFGPWLNLSSKYASCFSGKSGFSAVVAGEIEKGEGHGDAVVGGEMVLVGEKPPSPVSKLRYTVAFAGGALSTRLEASRSMCGRASRGRGGAQVRSAWRPKAGDVTKEILCS
ncbi:hypothetical protein F8388_013600 [Cannabis sativa]|uniref:CCHC-type domain-containing protein n=1 Tax=Cannabis sativa TaxID=3483 RepID=A0A7J6G9B2_CANSA|nr:hypothetical protein F8388_013600 [Cannabis sativa]KAF4398475.1 hypothetical protein G4B88_025454 [Cannabis sativa]